MKCPVCGRFTSEKAVNAHMSECQSRINALSAALSHEQERNENLGKWLDERRINYDKLKEEYRKLRNEVEYLRSRNWWQRLWNK